MLLNILLMFMGRGGLIRKKILVRPFLKLLVLFIISLYNLEFPADIYTCNVGRFFYISNGIVLCLTEFKSPMTSTKIHFTLSLAMCIHPSVYPQSRQDRT